MGVLDRSTLERWGVGPYCLKRMRGETVPLDANEGGSYHFILMAKDCTTPHGVDCTTLGGQVRTIPLGVGREWTLPLDTDRGMDFTT
ncbi:hypothetical protein XENTR_v10014029 [Xenopus tropicalis]|nr:hypothetical protein XENTR_v10014029 [Xenopus tropicalis]